MCHLRLRGQKAQQDQTECLKDPKAASADVISLEIDDIVKLIEEWEAQA
jgi:hypothetical protein